MTERKRVPTGDEVDIGRERILMEYHSILYRLTGIPMDFTSAGGECFKLCPEHHINPICRLIRSSPEGRRRCGLDDSSAASDTRARQSSVIYTCHAGLTDIAVPIFLNKKFVGCVTAGQLLTKRPTAKDFKQFVDKVAGLELNVSEPDLKKHFYSTPVLDEEKLSALVDLISLIGNYIVDSQSKLLFFEKIHEGDKVSVARRFTEKNYMRKISVEDVAAQVFLSASRFSHLFKKEAGSSFVQYLNKYRIEKAKELLLNTNMCMTDVSEAVGFVNHTHFNRIFKKLEGQSPAALKKSRKGK